MYIKLKIEGETLELLRAESQNECRTPTQQCLYIIKSYYKDKVAANKESTVIQNETIETELEQSETIISNDTDDIPSDIFNF